MDLPTDVLLRTSDHQGSLIDDAHTQWSAWVFATPIEHALPPMMFEPALDAGDELQAAPIVAAHGWYRQGAALLRTALEVMMEAAALSVTQAGDDYALWRAGQRRSSVKRSLEALLTETSRGDLFDFDTGVLGVLHHDLCRPAHAQSGSTNADVWQSNGPVWRPGAFVDFWLDFCDTVAICYVPLKLGWPALELPSEARPLFAEPSTRWRAVGPDVPRDFFEEPIRLGRHRGLSVRAGSSGLAAALAKVAVPAERAQVVQSRLSASREWHDVVYVESHPGVRGG